jgi:hypothetical protein
MASIRHIALFVPDLRADEAVNQHGQGDCQTLDLSMTQIPFARGNYMNDQTLFRRIAAFSAILAAPLQATFLFVSMLAIDFNVEIMADPTRIISIGEQAAGLIRWSEILDIFSLYVLLVPVVLNL